MFDYNINKKCHSTKMCLNFIKTEKGKNDCALLPYKDGEFCGKFEEKEKEYAQITEQEITQEPVEECYEIGIDKTNKIINIRLSNKMVSFKMTNLTFKTLWMNINAGNFGKK